LFQEAFEPAFLDNAAAHEIMTEYLRVLKIDDEDAKLITLPFRGANTIYILNQGDVALVAGGQFKIGRMGISDTDTGNGRDTRKQRRLSYLPNEMRVSTKAFMSGEIIGPYASPKGKPVNVLY
jgi:hypothetical protein